MLAPAALRALARELQELHGSAELRDLGIRVSLDEADVTNVAAEIDGPRGTPYEGGTFRMRLTLPPDFPASPPKGFFATRIWHPNVSKAGEICVNVLKKDWAPTLGLRHVLLVVRCLLIEPYPESALNEEAGRALLEDYDEYARTARLMTDLHAGGAAAKRAAAAAAAAAGPGGGGMPLTSGSGANAAGGEPGGSGAGPDGSPAVKKAKPAGGPVLSKAKKSLKRL